VAALPVVAVLGELRAALASRGSAVLVAPPGAGKTTVVPLALVGESWLAHGWEGHRAGRSDGVDGVEGAGRVVVLEPRRLAARAAAERMAYLLGERGAGGRVGYRVRGETRVGPDTRIEVVTEGVLTRMLQSDPSLGGIGLVVFDEFHERSVHADLGLALTLHTRSVLRPDLRLLVMSATLDPSPISAVLGDAPVVVSDGRTFPVETRWRKQPVAVGAGPRVASVVAVAVERALATDDGDVLVFLPGAGEIRWTERRLTERGLGPGVRVRPLFGDLSRGEQDGAIAPSRAGERKVVLATSIAETSLTIEGVRVVIDSGLMRVPRFDPGTGLTRLATVRVTRDAADQRRGRAGRTAPGVCYRLWTRAEDRGLVRHRSPEILEADLAPLALELAAWGADPGELRWLDSPPPAAFAQARELLRELEAVDDDGAATGHGRELARLGVHPRLGHMLLRGRELGLASLACDLAALLTERDILRSEGRAPDADLRIRVDALRRRGGAQIDPGALHRVRQEAKRLGGMLHDARHAARHAARPDARPAARSDRRSSAASGAADDAQAGVLAALAYPDRIGQRREGERGRFLLRNGRGARFAEPQTLEGEDWIVAAEVEGRGTDARIFRAAPLTLEDVETHFGPQAREVEEVFWDQAADRVVARRRRVLGALTLSEAPLDSPDPAAVAAAMTDGVRAAGLEALPWTSETMQLRHRLAFLNRLDPDRWPDASEAVLAATLEEWLLPFVTGLRRGAELRQVDLAAALMARVPWERARRLDELAPTHVEVPSGSRIRVDYTDPATPALAVRLQEVFGLLETPRVGGGRVPLTLQLLSPAQRPVQVTRDLASFWREAYFDVRKDLRGRYPKHHWPDDPLTAQPTRRTSRHKDPGR
jgi:ATP-dependent helicase HrpB